MGTGVLVDSSILIDFLNGVPEAKREIHSHINRAISVISWIEVTAGIRAGEESRAEAFLGSFQLLQLTTPIAVETANIRRNTRLKLPDAVILATAHVEKRTLLTRNTRDFGDGVSVRIPYTL